MYGLAPARRARTVYALPSGRFLLGAVPPDSFFAQVELPQISDRAAFRQKDLDFLTSAIAQGYVPAYTETSCSTGVVPATAGVRSANVTTAAGGALMSVAPYSGPVAGPVLLIAGAITTAFGGILKAVFGGHAKAVAREQMALCQAVPTANQFLQQIDAAFQSGQVSADQASQLLSQVLDQWQNMVATIIKRTASACNAACVYTRILEAIIAKRRAIYADAKPATPAAAVTAAASAISAAVSTTGFSRLLPWAAAAFGLYLLLEEG